VRSHAYELAFASEDEMFHSTLYDWLIEKGLADELLEVRAHSTIEFTADIR
jgi:nuclear pore complex protein Nup155